jgi:hypothetical protein
MTGKKSFLLKAGTLAARISASLAKALALTLALVTITGASVWEGSAALAPRGELPEDGYYAATNSFPQNTVVDITNLETGKSIRAIVSSGLNTPGLLAILSPDTANRIGLTAKTIGRIRMTQPQDPIAFSRFTEGLVASGDPDYNPQAMLAGDQAAREEAAAAEQSPPRRAPGSRSSSPPANTGTAEPAPPSYEYEPPRGVEYPDYAAYSHSSIVDMAGDSPPSPKPRGGIADDWDDDWDELSYAGYPLDGADSPESTNYRIWEQGGSVGTPEPPAAPVQRRPAGSAAPAPADPWAQAWEGADSGRTANYGGIPDQGQYRAEVRSDARTGGNESSAGARVMIRQPSPPPAPPPAPAPPAPGTVEYILVPTDPRPPARQGPEPERPTVDPINPAARQVPQQEAPEPRLDESLFIDSIEKVREERARTAETAQAAEAARLAEERRAAAAREAQRKPQDEVIVILNNEEEPRGRWVDPIAEVPEPAPPSQVLVRPPEEAGDDPRGPWVDPIAEAPESQPPPSQVLVRPPEEAGEPRGPWVDSIDSRPASREPPAPEPRVTIGGPPAAPETATGIPGTFSVPVNVITDLEKGKYYVQLGAYHNTASVESALLRVDPKYPLNVQNSGSADNPVYRILVGPVNLGESGALVQRFKGRGYRDAYVRTN